MPTIEIFGVKVRVRAMLNAISAQEWLEHVGRHEPSAEQSSKYAGWLRSRGAAARRRNRLMGMLREQEHSAFEKWRAGDEHVREATRAILTDLPGKGER